MPMAIRKRRERWTAADIPDLAGMVVVVTGSSSGIGLEAAREFARRGAETILACRSPERGARAMESLRAEVPGARAELLALDLASLASVERFAREFSGRYSRLDVLANNAGIMGVDYGVTDDGFERHVGTNHLGHFALTGRLLDVLLDTPGARVVTVSSMGHRRARLDLDDLLYETGGYGPLRAYYRSKLLNLLFAYELHRRFERAGAGTLSLAAHPGLSATNLAHNLTRRWHPPGVLRLFNALVQGPEMGALPTLRASVDPAATSGRYYGPRGPFEERGHPVVVSSSRASRSEANAHRLWTMSEELTGVRYTRLEPAGDVPGGPPPGEG